jgi:signal recognition particle subunit SRP72
MAVIWRKTADFHMQGDQPQVAAQALEELLKADPSSKQTMAQLVLAYARFDLKRALEASKRLPDFRQGAVDVDALEAAAFMGVKYVKKAKAAGAASPVPGKTTSPTLEGEAAKKKKTRKRKKRLPKNYNPEVDPDPERWLPKRERTGYRRPRKDRRRGEKFTGAQGTAAGQSEVFDYSQKKATAASGAVPKDKTKSPAVATQEASGPRQQQRKVQAKKKGKTGKGRF